MRKFLVPLFVSLLFINFQVRAEFGDCVVDVEVVTAVSPDGIDRSAGNGTCVEWRNGYALIVTACHVIKGKENVTITFPNRRRFYGKLVAETTVGGTDLAAVLIKCPKQPAIAPIATRDASPGDPLWVIGDSSLVEQPIRKGTRIALPEGVSTPMDFRTDVLIGSGDSGGGVFNADGELVSVLSGFEIKYKGQSVGESNGADTFRLREFVKSVRWSK